MKKIDHLIFKEYKISLENLAIYRIFFCLFSLLLGIPDFQYLGRLPQLLYKPPYFSLQNLFLDFPLEIFFTVTTTIMFLLYLFILFGYKTKFSSILLTIVLLLNYGFSFTLGKINHSNMVTIWIPLLLGLAGWGKKFSIDSNKKSISTKFGKSWPVVILTSILCFGMFSAGLAKLNAGWLSFEDPAVKFHFIKSYAYGDRKFLLSEAFFNLRLADFIWEILDYITVIFEILFLFVIYKKNWLKQYIFIALIFHFFNVLVFNISFLDNFFIYLLFIPFTKFINPQKLQNFTEKFFSIKFLLIFTTLLFILWKFKILIGIRELSALLDINILYTDLIIMIPLIIFYSLQFLIKPKFEK